MNLLRVCGQSQAFSGAVRVVEVNVSKLDIPVKKLKCGTIKTYSQNIVSY